MKGKFTKLLAIFTLLIFVAPPAWVMGQTRATTYKLQEVTSVSAGNKYVFVQGNHAMNNTTSSNALQTTTSYSTTGLSGTESYVWTLESATGGFYMKNVSLSSSSYLNNNSSSTSVSFGSKNSIWTFSFTDGIALISNKSNENRFLGYTSSTSYAYKAYATSNLSSYSHAITVYQLVEELNYTITAQSNNTAYGTVSISGKVITATANSGYRVSTTDPYSVSPSESATVVQNGNQFTVTPSANTTVTINFEAIPTYTVTLGDDNTTLTETSAGGGVTLPTRSNVDPYTFAGWFTTSIQTETTTAPTIINAGIYYPTSNITLYPVYTRSEDEDVTQWQKVSFPSSESSLSGTYALLTPDGYAFNGEFSSGHGQVTSTAFTFSNNIATSVPSDVCELTFEAVSDGFKIKKAGTNQYFYASKATSGNLAWHTTENSYWRSTGSNLLYNSNSAYLRSYNNSSFRSYSSSSNGQAIGFAQKVTASVSITYYISVVSPAQEYTLTVTTSENVEIFTFVGESTDLGVEGNTTQQVYNGTTVGLSVFATEGYELTLTVDGDDVTSQLDDSGWYEFIMPTHDVTVTATATAIPMVHYTYSINGVEGEAMEAAVGSTIDLQVGADLNEEFTFAGWTTDPNDVSQRLTSFTFDEEDSYIFYAVYAQTTTSEPIEEVVILDGSGLTSTATTEPSSYTNNGFNYMLSAGAKFQTSTGDNRFADKAILIGKSGAYIYNTDAFGQGITSFEVYANKGASTNVSVGINFSTTAIESYNASATNTWTQTLSTIDHVYDASSALPEGAKYFWYQITNANNSQVQFRITYTYTVSNTTYYTRVFINETAAANMTISGPSIIPSGSILDMDENMLTSSTAANLVIEDGGQLIHSSEDVKATVKKSIKGYGAGNEEAKANYYLIASPVTEDLTSQAMTAAGLTPYGTATGTHYDLYAWDGTQTDEEWQNWKNSNPRFSLKHYDGYLYANQDNIEITFTGTLEPSNNSGGEVSYHNGGFSAMTLFGNPFTCDAYLSANVTDMAFYRMNADGNGFIPATGAIKPMEGFFVQATDGEGPQVFSIAQEPLGKSNSVYVNLIQGNGLLDRAILRFDNGNTLEKFSFSDRTSKLYIPQGTKDYAVVRSNNEGEMPVSFKAAENGTYTFSVNVENVEMNYLHLIDNLTGTDVDLLATPSYSFEANTRDYANRFKLVFKANTGVEENTATETFAYFNGSEWVINNNGNATLQVVDMMGRVLSTETINGNAEVNLNQAAGVYMLRLVNKDNVKVQKVVVR